MASRQSTTLRSRGAYLSLETSSTVSTLIDFSGRATDFQISNSKQTSDDTALEDTDKVSTNQLNDRTASITLLATAENLKYVHDWDSDDDFEALFEYGTDGNASSKPRQKGQLSLLSYQQGASVGASQTLTCEVQVHNYSTDTF